MSAQIQQLLQACVRPYEEEFEFLCSSDSGRAVCIRANKAIYLLLNKNGTFIISYLPLNKSNQKPYMSKDINKTRQQIREMIERLH